MEQQLQPSKEIVTLVDIGVLEEDYSSEWASPSFAIPKKNGAATIRIVTDFRKHNLLLKHRMSPISFSKDWGHDPFNGRVYFASALDLNMGYYSIKLDADAQNVCTIVFPWHMGKYKYKRLPMGIKIAPDVFKTSCQSFSKIWNMLRPILMIC
jgi:hypothetical protein